MSPEQEELVRACVLADVVRMGEALYWRRRAETFEWAKPRLGERHAGRSNVELSAAWRRCDEIARACRRAATLAEGQVGLPPDRECLEVEYLRGVA